MFLTRVEIARANELAREDGAEENGGSEAKGAAASVQKVKSP